MLVRFGSEDSKPEPDNILACIRIPTTSSPTLPSQIRAMADQLQLNPNSVTGLTESSAPSDDDEPTLSSNTLAALKEFLAEQQQHHSDAGGGSEVSLVSEDWNLSQFWYSPETAKTVAEEVLTLCGGVHARVACISCPTLYVYLKVCSSAMPFDFYFSFD